MIRDNIDYNRWCHLLEILTPYLSASMYIPKGFRTAFMMTLFLQKEGRDALNGSATFVQQAKAATYDRLQAMASPEFKRKDDDLQKMMDMVAERSNEGSWTLDDITTELLLLMGGGSDTVASALISIFYYLHKHPVVLGKLLNELDTASANGTLSYPVRYNEAIKIRYLWAVIQESLRIHTPVGTGLPRVVPPGGANICGRFYPEDCELLMSPMVVNFNKDVFGQNSHDFDPERWLTANAKKVAQMERCSLNFGHGPRVCMGRQVRTPLV
jgi:cytochrome P450